MPTTPPRSPYDTAGGIVYFPRMLQKIRLHQAGQLAPDYIDNLGGGFDLRCCQFLGVDYTRLREQALSQPDDAAVLEWCFANGKKPAPHEIEVWNGFMTKRGWRDEATPTLDRRKREGGFEGRADICTMFDYIDLDEGRDPAAR